MTDPVLERARKLATATIGDALDLHGFPGVVSGIPRRSGHGRIAGFAQTAHAEVGPLGTFTLADFGVGPVFDAARADAVLVIDLGGADVSTFGGLAALAVSRRRAAGVVIDGGCRDLEEIRAQGQDIVYREMAGSDAAAAGTEPAPRGDQCRLVTPSAPLLSRYSAITFNSHRIHYDRSYSVEVERYPGLVVHGPLQATLLLQFAAELRGSAPRRFDFRSGAPLFDLSPFHLNARDAAAEMERRTAADGGPAAMTARAAW